MGQRITTFKVLVAAAVGLATSGAVVAVASPAVAGTNGQYVVLCTDDTQASQGRAWGPSNTGAHADSNWRGLSGVGGGNRCVRIGDIRFVGTITVVIKRDPVFGGDKYATCTVPKNQGSLDEKICRV
jgi:hypothetical protein